MRHPHFAAILVALAAACAPAAPTTPTRAQSPGADVPSSAPSAAPAPSAGPAAPVARKEPKTDALHGYSRVDDYFWLRKKDTPEVVSYLNEENAYTDAVMKPTQALQEKLYKELLGRIKETDLTVPMKLGEWLYYSRTEQGKQYPIHCRKKGNIEAAEAVILDLNETARTEKFVGLRAFEVSDDGNLLAYSIDTTGFRQFTLHVKDLRTGVVHKERIPRTTSVAFARDNRTLLYVVEDPVSKRAHRLYRHVLGEDPAKDPIVYEEKDEKFDLDVDRSRSKDYLFVTSSSRTTSEVRVIPAAKPTAEPKLIAPREHQHEYYVDHGGDLFYIRTNSGGKNFRLVTTKASEPRRETWKEIVPHRADVMLERADVFADHYVLFEREDALPRIRITDIKTRASHRIEMPEAIYTAFPDQNPEFKSGVFRFSYLSPVTPRSVFDYNVRTHEKKLLKQTEVLGGYDPTRYASSRAHAVARDGTKIPISILHKKGAKPDGKGPMLLSAYGSYGFPSNAGFDSNRFSLVDRGFTYAVAHIRGGGDLGKAWHDQGRMMAKMNTFTDFIDSAEYLIKEGWTTKDRLAILGGSAGGLLMGAVTNMRPDLFKVVLAMVPFVDVVNTMLDESLPLTVTEFEEWGNPKVKGEYDYMMKYSPYENIAAKAYPTILVKTSYNDSQVMYWEPAKYVARLRAKKTDSNPLLFKINMEPAGHGGQSGRYDRLRETAFDYAFLLTQLGIPE